MTGAELSLSSHRHLQFVTIHIFKCLAPCKECTGNYISEILQKRFLCHYRCHKTPQNDFGSARLYFREEGF
jgi:hypothetical protein